MLLIAPTGAGKTLAGFLPSLTDLAARGKPKPGSAGARSLHTLYISPLKALAVDIERNLAKPVEEMGLPVRIETRTGDTPQSKRARQRTDPPDILLTTPEQVSLLIANAHAERLFSDLRYVIFDELHSLIGLQARAFALAGAGPAAPASGAGLRDRPFRDGRRSGRAAALAGAAIPGDRNHAGRDQGGRRGQPDHHNPEIEGADALVRAFGALCDPGGLRDHQGHRTTLIFVNTRSQAELLFQELWRINDDSLPIALHHGSLDAASGGGWRRRWGATSCAPWSHLDARSRDRLGRCRPRRACRRAEGREPAGAADRPRQPPHGRAEPGDPDPGQPLRGAGVPGRDRRQLRRRAGHAAAGAGALDVLAQHVLGMACAGRSTPTICTGGHQRRALPFARPGTFEGDRFSSPPAATRSRATSATPASARRADGLWRISNPQVAQQYRLNIGTIVEAPMLNVRMVSRKNGGRRCAAGHRWAGRGVFPRGPDPGDTFLFSGKVLRFEGIRENECLVSKAWDQDPKVPAYAGGKFPLSTYLADRCAR
jgi:ATP-dependent Lhr-like helicase